MPRTLSPDAKREWRRITALLAERGTLSRADGAVLEIYCETFSRWAQAQRLLARDGITIVSTVLDSNGAQVSNTKIHPCLRIAENAERAMRQHLATFGCTPESREKVLRAKPEEAQEEESILTRMLREK